VRNSWGQNKGEDSSPTDVGREGTNLRSEGKEEQITLDPLLEIVDAEVRQKLRAGGFADVKSIGNAIVAEIHEATGLSMEKPARLGLDKLQTSDSGFVSASQLYKIRKG
jgi:hypothetical protein